jgi:hypothetical protein
MHPANLTLGNQAVMPTQQGRLPPLVSHHGGGPDLWDQMALVNTTVKQCLVSSAWEASWCVCVYIVWRVWRGNYGKEG